MIKIAVLGGSGYTALELLKILLRHPQVEIVAVTSRQSETPAVAELHPSLFARINLQCQPFDADRLVAALFRSSRRKSIADLKKNGQIRT